MSYSNATVKRTIEVQGKPAPKGSLRCLGRGRHVESCQYVRPWMQAIRTAWQDAHPDAPLLEVCSVHMWFDFDPPKSAKGARDGLPMIVKPDLDKLVRAVLDALTGLAYYDDSCVYEVAAAKYYTGGLSASGPGVMITVEGR